MGILQSGSCRGRSWTGADKLRPKGEQAVGPSATWRVGLSISMSSCCYWERPGSDVRNQSCGKRCDPHVTLRSAPVARLLHVTEEVAEQDQTASGAAVATEHGHTIGWIAR